MAESDIGVSSSWYADARSSLARLETPTVCRQTLLEGVLAAVGMARERPRACARHMHERATAGRQRGECAANSYFGAGITCPLACWVTRRRPRRAADAGAAERVRGDFYTAALWRHICALSAAVRTPCREAAQPGRAESDAECPEPTLAWTRRPRAAAAGAAHRPASSRGRQPAEAPALRPARAAPHVELRRGLRATTRRRGAPPNPRPGVRC